MKKKIISVLLSAVVCASLLAGCGSDSSQDKKDDGGSSTPAADTADVDGEDAFVLGAVAPLSGSSAVSGQVMLNAVQMAVDEINEAGGINGELPIKLVYEDDEAVPANSVTVTQKLVEQSKINALIGSVPSSCTLANMEITQKAKIPHITSCSSNITITQQGNPYIYRMTATDATHAKTLLKYATEALGAKTCAMINESSDFGMGAYNIVEEACADYGLEMVAHEIYNSGDTDFSVQLTKMQQTGADVFILWGYYTETALICQQMEQYGIDTPLIGTGYNSPELTELGGSAVDGLILTTPFDAADPAEKVQTFDKQYTELYGAGYDQNAPQSYDAVYVLADAVTRCMNDGADWRDGDVLTEYIRQTELDGATGITTFDETGEMVKDLLVIEIENGEHKIVEW